MRIDFLDHQLEPLVSKLTTEFLTVKGVVHRVGNLEKNASYTTETKLNDSKEKSITTTHISHCIPLIKIGNKSFSDVRIDSSSIFYALKVGNEVGCIFNKEKASIFNFNEEIINLHFVRDYEEDIRVGSNPGIWQEFFTLIFSGLFVITLLFAVFFITSAVSRDWSLAEFISSAIVFIFSISLFGVGFFILARLFYLAEKKTKSNLIFALNLLS